MTSELYATPRDVGDPANCTFYHTMDLPGYGVVDGHWDLRGNVDRYLGGVNLKGKSVLDVGCASGFLSFEMEQRGARVTSFDADDACRYHHLPFQDGDFMAHHDAWLEANNQWLTRLHNSYWLAHRALGSHNRVVHGDVYDIPAELGPFDVCVIGQILIHLRDPIQALTSVARVCKDTLVISEAMLNTQRRIARFDATAARGPVYHFWLLSRGTYRELLAMLGFEIRRFTRNKYLCHGKRARICTIVAQRT
jgi:SAM-dependent methyltransferase